MREVVTRDNSSPRMEKESHVTTPSVKSSCRFVVVGGTGMHRLNRSGDQPSQLGRQFGD